jgi:hypothetical protein
MWKITTMLGIVVGEWNVTAEIKVLCAGEGWSMVIHTVADRDKKKG